MWAKLLKIPRPYLYAGILVFAAIGTFSVGASFGLWLLLAMGLLGFAMRRFDIPLAPTIIGVILGPMAETQMRRALQLSNGDPSVLVGSPVAIIVYVLVALIIAGSVIMGWVARRRSIPAESTAATEQEEHLTHTH
jgi:putative tricarboxylic transport membrane protein